MSCSGNPALSKFVGVTRMGCIDPRELKRALLFVDQIAVMNLGDYLSRNSSVHPMTPEKFRQPDLFAAELRRLAERGLVYEPKLGPVPNGVQSDPVFAKYQASVNHERGRWAKNENGKFSGADLMLWLSSDSVRQVFATRVAALQLSQTEKVEAVYLGEGLKEVYRPGKHEVMHLVLHAIPLPAASVSMDELVEFRSDKDARDRFMGLRVWMSEMARSKLTLSEISEKLEWLLSEYERHIALHKMKIDRGTLETLVTVTAEMAENLTKLQFKNLAKLMFLAKKHRLELMEAELSAPGRELSFIALTRQKYGQETS